MRYAFLEKRSNKQQETAYMVYMIIGSYFHKCTCKTKILENKLFLSYKEMGKDKQEEKESRIIKVVERVLGLRRREACRLSRHSEANQS